jgi:hypothetical protein
MNPIQSAVRYVLATSANRHRFKDPCLYSDVANMMRTGIINIRGLLLCAAVLASGVMSASAMVRIAEDRGGQIGHYQQTFAMFRSSGERVVVDGNCLSACTLVLGLVPRAQLCATARARFGFHSAWMPDSDGHPITSSIGTQALWDIYPTTVQHWISRHGGLSRKMIYLQGRDLDGIVASCGQSERRIQMRSANRYIPRPLRYEPASAVSYRR